MPKPPAYELADAEKRDLAELIRTGQPLAEKYCFILFADKRDVEFVWNGKTRDVCTTVLAFQRALELTTAEHAYDRPGRYIVAVKAIDIFGNDTMTLVPVNAG